VTAAWRRATLFRPPPLLRQTGIYTASQLISRALPFLLLPILTRYLTPADYGIVAMFLLVALLVEPFVGLGLSGAITVRYYDRDVELPRYLGTGIVVVTGAAAFALLVFVVFGGLLSDITDVPPVWLLLVVPLVLARSIGSTPLALLRVREKAAHFGVFQNAQSIGLLTLAIVLVVVLGYGWEGRIAAEVFSWMVFAVVGLALMWWLGWVAFTYVKSYAVDLIRFGGPLIPHLIGSVVIFQIDRLLLTNMVGVDETGLYTVAFQLALVVELIAISFNNAYAPWLYRRLGDADDHVKRRLVRLTYVGFAGLAVLALATAIVMPSLAGVLLDPSYLASGAFVPWLALGFMFSGMYYLVTNYIFYAGRTAWLGLVTGITAVINIGLTYVLIDLNGAMGAAQASAITFAISFGLTWIASQRAYPMPWLGRWSRRPAAPSEGDTAS
jgi:O-antigen/teichoic acid export membrane protein